MAEPIDLICNCLTEGAEPITLVNIPVAITNTISMITIATITSKSVEARTLLFFNLAISRSFGWGDPF
ncbi:hypothetical protein D3C85_1497060 [compost metagenome]